MRCLVGYHIGSNRQITDSGLVSLSADSVSYFCQASSVKVSVHSDDSLTDATKHEYKRNVLVLGLINVSQRW